MYVIYVCVYMVLTCYIVLITIEAELLPKANLYLHLKVNVLLELWTLRCLHWEDLPCGRVAECSVLGTSSFSLFTPTTLLTLSNTAGLGLPGMILSLWRSLAGQVIGLIFNRMCSLLSDWQKKNIKQLNGNKFEIRHFSNETALQLTTHSFLAWKIHHFVFRDFGAILDSNLSSSFPMNNKVNMTRKLCSWIVGLSRLETLRPLSFSLLLSPDLTLNTVACCGLPYWNKVLWKSKQSRDRSQSLE